ncbi:WapI family immunity protein [Janthinobacterium sp. P210005]|uniref:WapI family immunity protein n=1 Tax=Janthinobacterium sp. P210005 TaxID=3112938 RepID=UPI002E26E676|nr:hypothetical protein [Janthinobacterium sp. P210005]
MHQIHIGNDSEFVEIIIRKHNGTDDWVGGDAEIRVRGFSASISADFEPTDFQIFEAELRALYENLSGKAQLLPREEQLTLKLRGNGRGGIEVSGTAWFVACYGSKLDFEFEIDQTYLPAVLEQLSAINGMLRVVKG